MSEDEARWLRLGDTDEALGARLRSLRAMAAPFTGLLADLVRSGVGRAERRAHVGAGLPERVPLVQAGRTARFPAVLHGDASWSPPRHAAERLVHVHGTQAWYTKGPASAEVTIPAATLVPAALRRPLAHHDVEAVAAGQRGWVALELVEPSEERRVTLLAHRTDLALLGLVLGWPYPPLVDVALGP